ncbi:GNAT family N-acetyltransferase [Actinoplanes sp. NPDC049599]|uniref:GNAT family N-acetyltransferase n=1 Tax=Actinoplanes sp. NPDC049599 TaxID=3363903 RepID=UPI0037BA88CB
MSPVLQERRDGLLLSTDPGLIDHELVHGWISGTYWATGRSAETMRRAIAGSEPVGVYREADGRQLAFARVVTDGVVFAYLCDVFVDPECRGRGLGGWLVRVLRDDLARRGLKRFVLVTRDAHRVYAPLGFEPVDAGRWMECDLQAATG